MSGRLITGWSEISEDEESVPEEKLTGWRFSTVLASGLISPFDNRAGIGIAECGIPYMAPNADVAHDGIRVHPGCTCGIHFCRTLSLCLEILDAYKETSDPAGDPDAASRVYGPMIYGGQVLLRVATTVNSHIIGPATRILGSAPKDPPGVARSNELQILDIYAPSNLAKEVRNKMLLKYRDVPAWELPGDLDSAIHCISDTSE